MLIVTTLLEIFLLGLIGGANPGPILTSVFTVVLDSSFKNSLLIILRALVAESGVALAILLMVYALDPPAYIFHVISLIGAAVLFGLAVQVWKIDRVGGSKGEIFSLSRIFLITILNGGFWIFWITICVPRAFELRNHLPGGQFLFLAVFELGWVAATAVLGYIFSRFRPWLQKKDLVSLTFKVFALLLLFFAIKSINDSIVYFWK